jgi:D-xylose transport system substrate-binding protein
MRRTVALAAVVLLGLAAGCSEQPADVGGGDSGKVALLLPESKTSRYESIDRPVFEATLAEICPDCELLYANAGQDAARQQQQAEAALTQGADVLVLDAVDSVAARSIVESAARRGVPVLAYDRFISEAPVDFFVAYDAGRVGQLQGQALVDALGTDLAPDEGILMVHGAATDPNSVAFKTGLSEVLFGTGINVLAEYDTPDWSPDKSQEWVEAQLAIFGDRVVGVYAANDGTASGAISAMRAAGMDPVPPVTGQDAELAAIQRIVAGYQYMTVYKRIGQQATLGAKVAVDLLRGEEPTASLLRESVPSILLIPVAVTRADIKRVIIDDGVYTVEEICTPAYRRACQDIGLLEEEGT